MFIIVNDRIIIVTLLMLSLSITYIFLIFPICFCDFTPTKEWQKVDPNIPVPPYLEYKLDLEKGETYVRLPQDFSDNSNVNSRKTYKIDKYDEKSPKFIVDSNKEYKKKLHHLSSDRKFLEAISKIDDGTLNKNIKIEKRSKEEIEEMKEFMNVLFPALKTESEIMKEIFESIKNNQSEIIKNLNELSYLLHGLDVAVDFDRYHGYEYFISEILKILKNSYNNISLTTNVTLVNKILHIFVTSAQNNDQVKKKLMDYNYDSMLLELIDYIFTHNLTNICESVLYYSTLSMNTFLKYCPQCTVKMLTNPSYNHTIQKLLSLPYNSATWKNIISLLDSLLDEKDALVNEDDSQYIDQVKNMSIILDKTLIDDHLCEFFTKYAKHYVEFYEDNNIFLKIKNKFYEYISPTIDNTIVSVNHVINQLEKRCCSHIKSNNFIQSFHNIVQK